MLLQKIKKFFREELPRIITTEVPFWYYNSRCRDCDFKQKCRKDAEGTISMIPYLSAENAKTFKSSQVDIEDLLNIVKNNDDKECDKSIIRQIIKYDKKSKSSPYLRAKETKQAQV
jgi:DNA replication ATP-dependent helicase Dna2